MSQSKIRGEFSRPESHKALVIAAGVFALALAARVAWIAAHPPDAAAVLTRLSDSTDYDWLARGLLEERGYAGPAGAPTVIRPPLYPLFLAAVYAVAGAGNLAAVALAQALLAALAAVLTMAVARQLGASRRAAALAGAAYALYPVFIYQSALILTEDIARSLQMGAALLTLRATTLRGWSGWLRAGALWGAAMLCRPAALAVAPALALWAILAARPRSLGGRLGCAVALVFGAALIVAPWTLRNFAVAGRVIPVAANFPVTRVHGTSPKSIHAGRWFAPGELIPAGEELLWHTQLRAFANPEEELARQDFYTRQWREWARAHPGRLTRLSLLRAAQFWSPVIQNPSRAARFAALATMTPVLLAGWLYVIMGLMGRGGGEAARRRWRRGALLCLALALAITLPHALSMPDVRYRTAHMDALWIAAGAALMARLKVSRARKQKSSTPP